MALLGLDTPKKAAVFVGYIALWCWIRGYIYYSAHAAGFPPYDRAAVVTAVSACKLALAAGFFLAVDGGAGDLLRQWRANWALFGKYLGLAVLYAAYDNLTFAALALLSPYTYQVVMQLRLVVTAVLWQLLFRRRLQRRQWVAIVLLTAAVAAFNISESVAGAGAARRGSSGGGGDHDDVNGGDEDPAAAEVLAKRTLGVALALTQIVCTVLAGIACEYFLKHHSTACVPLNLQNCFMYTSSILVNFHVTLAQSVLSPLRASPEAAEAAAAAAAAEGGSGAATSGFGTLLHWEVLLPLVLPMAAVGLVTSLVLRELDSVRKSIAGALELVGDLAASHFLFGHPATPLSVVLGAAIVVAVVFYSTAAPVPVPPTSRSATPTPAPRRPRKHQLPVP